ncbi:MAG: alpha/beta fold hydrolase [Alphaproteobacteria bacterium]
MSSSSISAAPAAPTGSDCLNGSDKDPRRAFGALFDPVDVAACRKDAAAHADARLYSTEPVIADLEEVRATLRYERVVLWGGSGGTRTAQVWLRAHPERIEAVALDGVVSMDLHAPSGYARGSQDALDRVFADCAAQASCNAAYPDLRAEFRKLLHRFDGGLITAASRPRRARKASPS